MHVSYFYNDFNALTFNRVSRLKNLPWFSFWGYWPVQQGRMPKTDTTDNTTASEWSLLAIGLCRYSRYTHFFLLIFCKLINAVNHRIWMEMKRQEHRCKNWIRTKIINRCLGISVCYLRYTLAWMLIYTTTGCIINNYNRRQSYWACCFDSSLQFCFMTALLLR